jgi:adenylylsulfate kinase-like enzyme
MSQLIIIRGNSGSGKSTIAKELRKKLQGKKVSIVAQDNIRRELLADLGELKTDNIELIELIINFSLNKNYITIVEGIYGKRKYEEMFIRVIEKSTSSSIYYLDIPFEETLNRHQTKPKRNEYGEVEMRRWYKEKDLLGYKNEIIIDPESSLEESVSLILEKL